MKASRLKSNGRDSSSPVASTGQNLRSVSVQKDVTGDSKVALTFADEAPAALGKRFNKYRERLSSIEKNGWVAADAMAECGYLEEQETIDHKLFEVTEIADLKNEVQRHRAFVRRRPCDGYSLQSCKARQFENRFKRKHGEAFFPQRYRLEGTGLSFEKTWQTVIDIAFGEFRTLDYLQPLASVLQAIRPDPRVPFITRCWDFRRRPGAIAKEAAMRLSDGDEFNAFCICYEPPTKSLLAANPTNYLIFRNVVGHMLGHYWWKTMGRYECPQAARDIEDCRDSVATAALKHQTISLFSIFLIMYRGAWRRSPLSFEQVNEAFDTLQFETPWAHQNQQMLVERLSGVDVSGREFPPQEPQLPATFDTDPSIKLSQEAILEIRHEASRLVERARPIPFASTAGVIGLRKLDCFISFEVNEALGAPTFFAEDRRAQHFKSADEIESTWREFRIQLPKPNDDGDLSLPHYLDVAKQLAHIRLHANGYKKGRSERVTQQAFEREFDADAADRARLLALALYAQDGNRRRQRMPLEQAQLLLYRDPSAMGYLAPEAEDLFQWSCLDPDENKVLTREEKKREQPPEIKGRFLGEVKEIGPDEIHLSFWEEDGDLFRTSLPHNKFAEAGMPVTQLGNGTEVKLFVVATENGPDLRPYPQFPESFESA